MNLLSSEHLEAAARQALRRVWGARGQAHDVLLGDGSGEVRCVGGWEKPPLEGRARVPVAGTQASAERSLYIPKVP